jgi:hypothetical protein
MLICERCGVEMRCQKNGVNVCIRPSLNPDELAYVYRGDTYSCPRCQFSIVKTNDTGFETTDPCDLQLSEWKSGHPFDECVSVQITYTPELASFDMLGSDLKAIGVAVSKGVLGGQGWEVIGGNPGGPLPD